jgi:hypothetical protein
VAAATDLPLIVDLGAYAASKALQGVVTVEPFERVGRPDLAPVRVREIATRRSLSRVSSSSAATRGRLRTSEPPSPRPLADELGGGLVE